MKEGLAMAEAEEQRGSSPGTEMSALVRGAMDRSLTKTFSGVGGEGGEEEIACTLLDGLSLLETPTLCGNSFNTKSNIFSFSMFLGNTVKIPPKRSSTSGYRRKIEGGIFPVLPPPHTSADV